MSAAISIITCPRPGGVSYVEATAAALVREGAGDCHRLAIVDGQEAPELSGWDVRFSPLAERQGIRVTMWRAFRAALEVGADRLIYCEDDIIPCKNAVRRMTEMEIPADTGFITFCDFKELPFAATETGLHRISPYGISGTGLFGNQCLIFPRQTLLLLVRRDPLAVGEIILPCGDRVPATARNHADVMLGHMVSKIRPKVLVHLPRLVRHVGMNSIAHPERQRAAPATPHYPGDDFDALSLRSA